MTADRQKLLSLYDDLRVADVRDGMDTLGQHYLGSMSPDIRPLWRTHAYGIARTARSLRSSRDSKGASNGSGGSSGSR